MLTRLVALLLSLRGALRGRADLALENLALRQQVAVLKEKRRRPRLSGLDRAFWVLLRRLWPRWADVLIIVKPETVVRWHRAGFRAYWRWRSKRRGPGRPPAHWPIRELIRRLAMDNPSWGAPRVHGELLKLGLCVSERTVSRYMPRRPSNPDQVQRWITFLRNHKDAIAAMDFFTVPTISFRVLYGFFVIEHGRRRVLHFNVTFNPTAAWVIQQLREAFPYDTAPKHLIFALRLDLQPRGGGVHQGDGYEALSHRLPQPLAYAQLRIAWQDPVAERWIGSCRRELLDHVVVFHERHLVRLVRAYISYHHQDRTHLGLDKDTPSGRPVTLRPSPTAQVVALPRVGGLHHRYEWRDAA